jgi:sarcosine oxidase subunit alpha
MLLPDRRQLVGLLTADPKIVLDEGAQIVENPEAPLPIKMLGHVTSSYWSATLGRSIALALVSGGRARTGSRLFVPTLDGRAHEVTLTGPVFYDPEGKRLDA